MVFSLAAPVAAFLSYFGLVRVRRHWEWDQRGHRNGARGGKRVPGNGTRGGKRVPGNGTSGKRVPGNGARGGKRGPGNGARGGLGMVPEGAWEWCQRGPGNGARGDLGARLGRFGKHTQNYPTYSTEGTAHIPEFPRP